MTTGNRPRKELLAENESLRLRLQEAQDALRAGGGAPPEPSASRGAGPCARGGTEAALAQAENSQAWLAAIVESSDDAIIAKDLNSIIISWNSSAERLFGYRAAEVIGKSITLLIPGEQQHEEEEILSRLRSGRRIEHFETVRICKDGRRIEVSVTISPIVDHLGRVVGASKIARGISERNRAELALKQSEERYRLLADTMLQGVVHQDAQGRIIAMNPAAQRILGRTREQFLGSCSLQEEEHCIRENGAAFPGKDHPAMVALRTGRPVRGVIMGVFNPELGARRWIGIDAVPVFRPGETAPSEVYTVFGDFTERRQAQEELRLSTERFQVALNGSPIVAFNQDLELRYTWVYNPALGYDVSAVLGKRDSDLFERAADAAATQAIKRQVISSGVSRRQEIMVLSKGVERCYDLVVDPLLDPDGDIIGVTCAAIDLTERKQAEEELRQKEERLRLALEAARMATWDWHVPSGEVVWNEMHYAMMGYRSREVEPSLEAWASRVHPDDLEPLRQKIRDCMAGSPVYSAEFRTVWPGGTVRWLEARGEIEYDARQEPQRFYGVMLDITERKRIEEHLRKWNEELEQRVALRTAQLTANIEKLKIETDERVQAMEALREKEQMLIQQSRLAAMGEMIGNIAHQWRQPLNLLGLTAQQLLLFYDLDEFDRPFLSENVGKQMEIIQHMSQTIDDFRNYFKPDKEKIDFKVHEVISNTLSLLKGSLQSLHIGLEIVAQDDPVIHGYPNEFAQVLLNLVINAKDVFAERDIPHPKVTITTCQAGGRAVVTVADNGGGIPEEIVEKIFDPYFTTKGPQRGTGVGLFMSKNIIEKNMGGTLTARNLPDGAEFRVEV